ncbi:MAG: type II secretion system protein GspM [Pseudomonadota bacterium]
MTLTPGTMPSRLAALALLVGALLLVSLLTIAPALMISSAKNRQAERLETQRLFVQDALGRETALLARKETLGVFDLDRQLISAATETAAAAAIQNRVTRLATRVGGSVESFAVLPSEAVADDTLSKISVRFKLRLTTDQLTDFLSDVGNEEPLLNIAQFEISAPRGRRQASAGREGLIVTAVIAGFQRKEGPSRA